ncbi:multiple epidermal growth factor-like domains protein 11 [Magallana gigas]|uniref:multiple epidermal growth factor-like domains protein 11 n=1 Tax=Magallana gigas TaxID=29159 RepID=UPI00334128B8
MGVTELCITLSVLFCKGVAYENVGFNKSAWEQYPYNHPYRQWGAERAVDGLYSDLTAAGGQCVISANRKSTAELRVDLERIHIIHHIVIYYRTEHIDSDKINLYASRFLGLSVYVSNTTDKDDGILCFMDMNYTLETIPNPINITCPNQESGRYVIYYNNRTHPPYPDGYSTYAFNELCEIEVFSCPYGFFGKDCTDKCNYTCTGCNDINGSCDSGCHPGWFGNYCNKACAVGTYGFECRETCGKCGDISQCINTNGTCLGGCKDGFQGILCKSPCNTGSYGVDCKEKCGNCLDVYKCLYTNGTCLTGCVAGYQGNLCKTPCTLGSYGLECRGTCGNCRMCSNTNGSCLTACDAGYLGILCKTPCSEGFYGPDCKQKCGNCLDVNKCLHTTGQCLTGCDVGYQGALCKTPCDRGLYGYQCREKCGRCRDLNKCFHITGVCLTGCDAGYKGSMCNATCRQGFFGKNCSHTCIKTCNGCNNVNGLCDSGCLLGWRGYFCSEFYGCSPKGYFGSNCSVPCPDINCQECHMESGICHVCKQGYKGQRCETVSELADIINGVKFYSLLGAFCLSLTVIGLLIGYNIMRRKRQLTQHQPSDLQGSRDVNLPNVSRDYANCEELRELRRSEIYDTIQ